MRFESDNMDNDQIERKLETIMLERAETEAHIKRLEAKVAELRVESMRLSLDMPPTSYDTGAD